MIRTMTRKNGWCVISNNKTDVQEWCKVHNYANKKACFKSLAFLFEKNPNHPDYKIYESYTKVTKFGEEQADVFVGTVRSSSTLPGFTPKHSYYAIFEPSDTVRGYNYPVYFISPKGNLIPRKRYGR